MKIDKKVMAIGIADDLLPKFKGLSEKSASKMIKSIDEIAKSLTKRFYKLQEKDCDYCCKMEKKLIKKENKMIKKAEKRAKIARIIATDKPMALITVHEPKKQPLIKAKKNIKNPIKI